MFPVCSEFTGLCDEQNLIGTLLKRLFPGLRFFSFQFFGLSPWTSGSYQLSFRLPVGPLFTRLSHFRFLKFGALNFRSLNFRFLNFRFLSHGAGGPESAHAAADRVGAGRDARHAAGQHLHRAAARARAASAATDGRQVRPARTQVQPRVPRRAQLPAFLWFHPRDLRRDAGKFQTPGMNWKMLAFWYAVSHFCVKCSAGVFLQYMCY